MTRSLSGSVQRPLQAGDSYHIFFLLTHHTMSLTLSSALSPFPYAAASLAAYTNRVELVFDDAAADVTLDLDGTVISGEEKIIEELAKVGGLPNDSTTVWPSTITVCGNQLIFASDSSPCLIGQGTCQGNCSFGGCFRLGRVRQPIGLSNFLDWP